MKASFLLSALLLFSYGVLAQKTDKDVKTETSETKSKSKQGPKAPPGNGSSVGNGSPKSAPVEEK